MEINLTQVASAVISLVSVLVAAFLIPFIKSKFSAEQLDKAEKWAKIAVQAAEMIFGDGKGTEKKEYVVAFLKSKGYTLDTDSLDNLIESKVLELKQLIKE